MGAAAPHLPPLLVPSAEEMESLGGALAQGTAAGDVIFLSGDLGAGKTSLSRGFVRGRTGDPRLRVTSPSYLLDQSYETGDDEADPM
jgi:tRNA A37 threonylcarbamoyladenosine biosynthesis protein TsaE